MIIDSESPNQDISLLIKTLKDSYKKMPLEDFLMTFQSSFNDPLIIKELVKINTNLLEYVSMDLRSNKEIMNKALDNNNYSFQYASDDLKNDKEFILGAVRRNGMIFKMIPEKYHEDDEIIHTAIKSSPDIIIKLDSNLPNFKEYVLSAVNRNPYILENLPRKYKNSKEVVTTAIEQSGVTIQFAPSKYRNDPVFMLLALKNDIKAYQVFSPEWREIIDINDPIKFLESFILVEKLEKSVPMKTKRGKSQKIKI